MFGTSLPVKALVAFYALSNIALAMPVEEAFDESDPLAGMTLSEVQWEVQAVPGGETLHMTGTVESVWEQLLAINPNYVADWGVEDPKAPFNETEAALEKRTDFTGSKVQCFKHVASSHFIRVGIKYLRGVRGRPVNDAGKCGRVSCSERSAIYWCNTSNSKKTLNSFGSIADGGQWLVDRCGWTGDSGVFGYVAGRVTHKTNWNVFISTANC